MKLSSKHITTLAEASKQVYGFAHLPYRSERCVVEVWEGGRSMSHYQCRRKNGHGPSGLYCKQHDPAAVEARNAASMARVTEKLDRETRPLIKASFHDELVSLVKELLTTTIPVPGPPSVAWQKKATALLKRIKKGLE